MQHTPPRQNGPLSAVCIPLIVLSVLFFFLGNVLLYASLWQAAGGICLTAFLFLNLRFSLSSYRYVIDGTSLIVYRKQGRREEALCNIELSTTLSFCDFKTFKKNKENYELCYNFCQNFAAKGKYCLRFTFNDRENRRALVYLEPSEEMISEIEKYVKK